MIINLTNKTGTEKTSYIEKLVKLETKVFKVIIDPTKLDDERGEIIAVEKENRKETNIWIKKHLTEVS